MTDRKAPRLAKWPFLAADGVLLGLACWIVARQPAPLGTWPLLSLVGCVALGAWIGITPFLVEYRAALKFAESDSLTTTVEQIENLRGLGNQITFATAQWQLVQEHADRSMNSSREIADRLTAEAKGFAEFMLKANDAEKAHLRLEVEKLRRGESEWLQVMVRLLDHVYALYVAGVRSGQANLREQLGNFQNACRDAARRLGVVAFEAQADEPFDPQKHQPLDEKTRPEHGARVAETLAAGFTFQGQLLRPALVSLKPPAMEPPADEGQLLLQDPS